MNDLDTDEGYVTATTVREALQEVVMLAAEEFEVAVLLSNESGDLLAGAETGSYEDLGMLTQDEGFVLRTADGRAFQVSIVRSR